MNILKQTKWTLHEKHPCNLSVLDEYSSDEWMVIVSYPCVSFGQEDRYFGCRPFWLYCKLKRSKSDDAIDNWIWQLDWKKDINEVKRPSGEMADAPA